MKYKHRICGDCWHWVEMEKISEELGSIIGMCNRFPPYKSEITGKRHDAYRPSTGKYDFCGEFTKKE
jgi:hypothetical protein